MGAEPLGRTSDGSSVWNLETTAADDGVVDNVFVASSDAAQQVMFTGSDPSPVWGNTIVVRGARLLQVVNLYGEAVTSIGGTEDCAFEAWDSDGSFTALCGVRNDMTGSLVRVVPSTGEVTQLQPSTQTENATTPTETWNAVDSRRSWSGMGLSGLGAIPPDVRDGGTRYSLLSGFANTPHAYAVIFGARN